MNFNPSYKQTEVGVIPEDWNAAPLKDVVWFQEGPGIRNWQFKPSGLKVINITNLQDNGYLDLSRTERHISWVEFEKTYKHFLIDDGDVVVASSGNSYGKTAVVRQADLPLLMNTSVIRFKAKQGINNSFMLIYLKSKHFKNQIDLMITGGAQPNFGPYHLNKVLVPLPPSLVEQRAIAHALFDVDALLSTQDKLIAKKRDIKQAAMQRLLTGKQRLQGFSGEWEVKQLGEVFTISAGKSKSAYVTAGGRYWIVDMGSVSTGGKLMVSKQTNFHGDFLKLGDLVMPKDDIGGGGIIGKVGYIDADETFVLGDHVYRLSANMGSPLFLSYIINSYRTNTELRKKVIGSAQLGLGRKSVEEQEVFFPSNEEQTAIAQVLLDIDIELTALEQQRDKTRALKQGMMQELLTGRIRLA